MNRHAKAIVASSAMLLTLALGASTASADTVPTVPSTDPAAQVGHTTALLSGEVDANWAPGDGPTTWRIQYRPEGSPDWLQANEGTLEAPDPVKVETPVFLEAKAASETYEFRLLAENAAGSAESASPYPSFATLAAKVPALTIDPADPLGYTTATLKGTVNPEGGNVNPLGPETLWLWWELQYSPKGQGAWSTAAGTIVEGPGAEATSPFGVEGTAVELSPGSEYETRLLVYYLSSFGLTTELQGADFTTKAVAKPTVTIDPVTDFDASTASFAGTVNPNAPGAAPQDPAFDATWSFSCEPACPGVSAGATVPAGDQAENVAGDATHLEPNTEYTVTLKATNAGGTEEASTSFKTPGTPPTIEPFEAGPIRHDGAGINGQVNPHNSPTTYYFEWGTQDCSANSCTALPASKDASAGTGPFNQYVFRELGGLSPQTTYHFRLVAENAFGTTEGPDRSFTTAAAPPACTNADALGASQLPDCRAWEMVSPPEKNGNDITAGSHLSQASADGNAILFSSPGTFGDAQGSQIVTQYMGIRSPAASENGWAFHSVTPPQESLPVTYALSRQGYFDGDLSADLSKGIYKSWFPMTHAPNVDDIDKFYLRSNLRTPRAADYLLLTNAFTKITASGFQSLFFPVVAGASADFDTAIVESRLRLTEDASALPTPKLYVSVSGNLSYVGRIPSTGVECDDRTATSCVTTPMSQAGLGATAGAEHYTDRMVSSDGSRVFFTGAGGRIYMREDASRTLQLNVSENDTPGTEQPAELYTASTDGRRAFFMSSEQLVNEDSDNTPDVYMVEPDQPLGMRLTLISKGSTSASGILAASQDGHYVYFASGNPIVPGTPTLDESPSIVLWHDEDLDHIGQISNLDVLRNSPMTRYGYPSELRSVRITPDGQHLLFLATSGKGLSGLGGNPGYDHGSGCLQDNPQGSCSQLYLYDAASRRLQCASCAAQGAAPKSGAKTDLRWGIGTPTMHQNNALSSDGRLVFFSTETPLVNQDTNGTWDAYEFDSESGRASLLSSGEDSHPSYFLDSSTSGKDVFFLTSERLSGWDVDRNVDLYDARTNGGVGEPVAPVPVCTGDSCQPPPRVINDPTPASSTTIGPGSGPFISRKGPKKCKPRGSRRRSACSHRGKQKGHSRKHTNSNGQRSVK